MKHGPTSQRHLSSKHPLYTHCVAIFHCLHAQKLIKKTWEIKAYFAAFCAELVFILSHLHWWNHAHHHRNCAHFDCRRQRTAIILQQLRWCASRQHSSRGSSGTHSSFELSAFIKLEKISIGCCVVCNSDVRGILGWVIDVLVALKDSYLVAGNPNSGFFVDLLNAIQGVTGIPYTLTARSDLNYGNQNADGSFNGSLIGELVANVRAGPRSAFCVFSVVSPSHPQHKLIFWTIKSLEK